MNIPPMIPKHLKPGVVGYTYPVQVDGGTTPSRATLDLIGALEHVFWLMERGVHDPESVYFENIKGVLARAKADAGLKGAA